MIWTSRFIATLAATGVLLLPPAEVLAQQTAETKPELSAPLSAPGQSSQNGSTPGLQTRLTSASDPTISDEYTLGGGDEISIDVAGRPELSGKHVVGPDGRITLPLVGSIQLADQTREQAADTIEKAMSPYYSQISLTVGVDKYGSNRVLILGAVEHPGIMYFDQSPTLLEAITRAGLLTSGGMSQPGQLHQSVPERCTIYRGKDQVLEVDLKTMLDSGNPLADLRLRRNDKIFIPSDQDRFVSVLGSVEHPGAYSLTSRTTLASLVAEAGGINEKAGTSPTIRVVQPSTGKTTDISYKSLLSLGPASDVKLHAGDVIYVPQSGFYKFTYVIERLSPIATVATFAALAAAQ